MEAFINNEIKKDINSLPVEKRNSNIIKSSLNKVMSDGINYSYMDKVLITTLALNDDNSAIKKLADNLRELYNTMVSNLEEIESAKEDLSSELEYSSQCLQELKYKKFELKKVLYILYSTFLNIFTLLNKNIK